MAQYTSRYTDPPKRISIPQYVAELVCYNNSKKNGVELPLRFWETRQWKGFYFIQLRGANKLLQQFNYQFVIDYIIKKRIWSLQPQWIYDAMEKDYKNYKPAEMQEIETVESPTFRQKKHTNIDFLDE